MMGVALAWVSECCGSGRWVLWDGVWVMGIGILTGEGGRRGSHGH